MKKILILIAVFIPLVGFSKPIKKEPVKHLTDEQIYEQLKKFALVFQIARNSFV